MKVMKKLLALGLSLSMLLSASTVVAAVTADEVDYSDEIAQIEALMLECDEKGISYDYETVNYETIKRFEEYIKDDINDGISDEIVSYNISVMDNLCEETVTNLEGYLNGTKTPKEVTLPDMTNVKVDGEGLSDDGTPVFSVGYGHANNVIDDIPDFNDFGTDNIQIEVGPTELIDYSIPFEAENHSTDYSLLYYTEDSYAGDFSLKAEVKTAMSSNVYFRFKQTVKVKPNTTYNFGTYAKVTDNSTNGLNIVLRGNDWSNAVSITPTESWQEFKGSFTTSASQTSAVFNIIIEGEAVCLFDDMYMYENGTTDNVLKNGDFEGTNTNVPFNVSKNGGADASVRESTYEKNSGTRSLKVTNFSPTSSNVYVMLTQEVYCKPNTTYDFGGFAKYINNATNGLSIGIFGNGWDYSSRLSVNVSGMWRSYSGTITTGAEQYSLTFMIIVEGEAECWFDDMYVREKGTKKNLLVNGTLENGSALSRIVKTVQGLQRAEMHNVGVSLLLSPHYFPTNIENVDYYSSANGFIKYNIMAEPAEKIIERHIRTILPLVKDYAALQNICLSNEPEFRTSNYADFYNPLFRAYLQEKHGDITTLNTAYNLSDGVLGVGKTSYDDFSDITMPDVESSIGTAALFYDWMEFNDKVSADWHGRMADIVEEYTDKPKHSKIMNTFRWASESGTREELTRGTDPELFDTFSDYAGNDVTEYYDDRYSYWYGLMFYDYLSSVTDKPLYNSETHIIRNGNDHAQSMYDETTEAHATNHLWMSAARGVSMHSIWIWSKTNATSSQAYRSLLSRPDAVAGIGKTSLDMTRLSSELKSLSQTPHQVALFYSKPSRVHNTKHMLYTYRIYQALINAGIKVGFVTENSLDKLSRYDALILGNVTNGTADAVAAIEGFMNGGGKVLTFGDALTKNEYNVSKSNSISSNSNCTTASSTPTSGYTYTATDGIVSAVNSFITGNSLSRVTLKDSDGNTPVGLDWSYYVDDRKLLVNITNLYDGETKNVNVYLDGEKITGMTELISGTENVTTASVESFRPQLLEYSYAPAEIYGITVSRESGVISWEYTEGVYEGARIYKLNDKNKLILMDTVYGTSYTCEAPGTYVVRAVLDDSSLDSLMRITVTFGDEYSLTLANTAKTKFRASADVTVKNTAGSVICGVVKAEILNADGEVENYHYQTLKLKGKEEDSFKIHLPISENAAKIRVSAVDSKENGNSIADSVECEL